ncbi:reverse transcriptase domain-containing protein [Tanacetum coccineum]
MKITVVTLVEEQMSSWKGNLPKLPIIIKYSAIGTESIEILAVESKVEGDGDVRVMTRGFGDFVAKLGDNVVMEVLVRYWTDGDVVPTSVPVVHNMVNSCYEGMDIAKITRIVKNRTNTDTGTDRVYKSRENAFKLRPLTYHGRATPSTQEGYGEAIVLPEINADHFEIKTNLLQLVQANPFYGRESENPHAHINSFKRITSTLRFRNVPNDVIKLMMFPYSLEGAAKTWYEKEPPNSILTWEDLVTKFVNQFFPPSKTTHLKNEISRFTQKFEETFSEAWERFKELLRACPHHGFTELTQVDTFYNGLNENEQDSLNVAAGGNLLSKMTREALNIIENKSKVRYSRNRSNASRMNATSSKTDERIDKLADQLST